VLVSGEITMLEPVWLPGSQVMEEAPLAVNVVDDPAQILLFPETVTAGPANTE
jgi:hypothetical protein